MNENVDLTEHGDFRVKSKQTQNGIRFLGFGIDRVPYQEFHYHNRFGVPEDDYYYDRDSGAIIQGDAIKREAKRWCKEFGLGNYCDCCGVSIKPYENNVLCISCEERMSDITATPFNNFI